MREMSSGSRKKGDVLKCRWCGEEFEIARCDQLFCSPDHRTAWHNLNAVPASRVKGAVLTLIAKDADVKAAIRRVVDAAKSIID